MVCLASILFSRRLLETKRKISIMIETTFQAYERSPLTAYYIRFRDQIGEV